MGTQIKVSTLLVLASLAMVMLLMLFHGNVTLVERRDGQRVDGASVTEMVQRMEAELSNLKRISAALELSIAEQERATRTTSVDKVQLKASAVPEVSPGVVTDKPPAKVVKAPAVASPDLPHLRGASTQPDMAVALKAELDSSLPAVVSAQSTSQPPTTRYPLLPAIAYSTTDRGVSPGGSNLLVVGGTDGSGSRRVVSLLVALGAPMVSEDPDTYDIHADVVGGWPRMVKPVLESTRTLKYDAAKLPQNVQQRVSGAINQVLDKLEGDSKKDEGKKLRSAGLLRRPEGAKSSKVHFGFKAPVSMTLLPYLVHLNPRVMFLHVLRDGRDIAFSANQGPVTKFYETMYGSKASNSPLNAVRLWSDWNTQIHDWSKAYAQSSPDRTKSFSYFMLHSEDLVDPVTSVRFSAIKSLAEWIGSSLSDDRLCCLAVQDSVFLGSHDRSSGRGTTAVSASARYGKWKTKVGNNERLKNQLHDTGRVGLKTFGYEPMRALTHEDAYTSDGYQCTLTATECLQILPKRKVDFSATDVCKVHPGVDYKGGDLRGGTYPSSSLDDCCKLCKTNSQCKYFTFVPSPTKPVCYLKSSQGTVQSDPNRLDGMVSGDVL